MGGVNAVPVVLAISDAGAAQARVRHALTPQLAVECIEPEALADSVAYLDAAAAVVTLDADSDDETLEMLSGLASLPAARALVLFVDSAPTEVVAAALSKLSPCQVLTAPADDELMRWAVARAMPSNHPGAGAREGQRIAFSKAKLSIDQISGNGDFTFDGGRKVPLVTARPTTALLGVSSAIRDVIEQVRQIAPTNIPALVLGETGTGKELVARAIHEQSERSEQPFVAVNCGALPDSLLESELFGHKRGAFTGADKDKVGLFEHANGGTLFLDEIGDTSPALQMKLLRVLENKEIRRLGDTKTVGVDVRVVSATHRDLEQGIEAGTFRQDLYYRLNTVTLHVPPLRRRRVDVPFLAQHFAEEFGASHARRITLSEELLDALSEQEFPGNVRELRNAVERAIALAGPNGEVTGAHLKSSGASATIAPADWSGSLKDLVDRVEADAIRAALERTKDNRSRAAASLGLTRPGLRYKMRRLGLEPGDSEPPADASA